MGAGLSAQRPLRVRALDHGLEALGHGLEALGQGLEALGQGLEALGHGLEALGQGLEALGHGLEALGHGLEALDHGLEALGHGLEALGHGLEALGQGLEALGHGLEDLLEECLHVRPATDILAEQRLEHPAVGAEQRGQTHQQARVVHYIAGPGHAHVLVQELLDDRVQLVNGVGAGQSGVAWRGEEKNKNMTLVSELDFSLMRLSGRFFIL